MPEPDQALISRNRVDTIVGMLHERIRATIDHHGMFRSGQTVLVAVSGGIDSVVLLDVLDHLASIYNISLHVAHLDHGLRRSSSTDAQFAARLAAERGFPISSSRLTPDSLSGLHRHGLEAAARESRYAFLERVASEIGADRIALGHTADDQAETIMHRLARGTGITGLCGIPPVRLPFIRPLLATTRAEIRTYARQRKLTWRADATNADTSFTRNRIRHRVLPQLEAINPKAIEAISRGSQHALEAEQVGLFLVSTLWDAVCLLEGKERLTFRRTVLLSYPPAVQKLLLREGVRRVRGHLTGIDHVHVEAIAQLLASSPSHGELSLPGLHIRRQYDELLLAQQAETPIEPWSVPIDLGSTELREPPITLDLEIVEGDRPLLNRSDRWTELADADCIAFPLELRSRRDGDRFTPLGMKTSVKVKDFLINEHVPYYDRRNLALLCDQEKLIWIVGVRLSDNVRVTHETRRYLSIRGREMQ